MTARSFSAFYLVALLAVAALGSPGTARAQDAGLLDDPTAFQKQIDIWVRNLETIEQEIEEKTVTAARIPLLEERARAIQSEARSLRSTAESRLPRLERELDALGVQRPAPPSEEGAEPAPAPQLSAGVQLQRENLLARIAEVEGEIRQANLVLTRAQEVLRQLSTLSSRKFAERLLSRGPPLLAPQTWAVAFQDLKSLFGQLIRTPDRWWNSSGPAKIGWMPWLICVAVALLGLLVTLMGGRWLRRRYGRTPGVESPGYGRAVLAAMVEGLTGGLAPTVSLFVLGSVAHSLGIASVESAPLFYAGGVALIIYLITSNIVRAVFSPEEPQWRLVGLRRETARILGLNLQVLTVYLAFAAALGILTRNVGHIGDELKGLQTLVINSGIAFLLFFLLGRWLWRSDVAEEETAEGEPQRKEDEEEEEGQPEISAPMQLTRLTIGAVLVAIPLSALSGYYELSRHISGVIVGGATTLGLIFLLRTGLHQLIAWLLAPEPYGLGPLSRLLALRRKSAELLVTWFRALVDIALVAVTFFLLLLIIGVPRTSISLALSEFLEGVTIGGFTFSPGGIIVGIALFFIGVFLTRFITRLLSERLLPRTSLDIGVRNSLTAAANYSGIILAGLIGISALGLDLSNLAIIAGALSVGIGFGLREVVNNFVSGLLLLIERPIKIGDWIVVGEHEGTVKRISVRSTEIETFDRAEVIVPNSELITASVKNWTHRSKTIRVGIAVGVAYGTDPQKVYDILIKLPEGHSEILRFPAPQVLFRDFGASSLDFELRFFLRDTSDYFSVPTKLRMEIVKRFEEEGITIPFPQRDIHIIDPRPEGLRERLQAEESGASDGEPEKNT